MVDGLSKLEKIEFQSQIEAQAENFRKMLLAMASDVRVILIKLADRLHNMRTMGVMVPAKRRRISRETMEVYVPIAHRLGLNDIYRELQDLSFSHLYPLRYFTLAKAIKAAFDSYGFGQGWTARADEDRGRQIVLVQAVAEGEIEQFLTRNAVTGAMGPAPVNGAPLPRMSESIAALVSLLDAKAGRHMNCLVAIQRGQVTFLSARPVQVTAAAELEAAVDRVNRKVW